MGLCVQERGIKQSVLFPQTMISRFNTFPLVQAFESVLISFDSDV